MLDVLRLLDLGQLGLDGWQRDLRREGLLGLLGLGENRAVVGLVLLLLHHLAQRLAHGWLLLAHGLRELGVLA